MRFLLTKIRETGEPAQDNYDIAAQLWRVMKEHPEICEDRILSEIGMLFVEGFETTGEHQRERAEARDEREREATKERDEPGGSTMQPCTHCCGMPAHAGIL